MFAGPLSPGKTLIYNIFTIIGDSALSPTIDLIRLVLCILNLKGLKIALFI